MAAASPPPARGMEVPILGSETLGWVDLTVPCPPAKPPSPSPSPSPSFNPPCRGASSCHVLPGDPPSYAIWRIHDDRPDVLEIIEFFPSKEFPERGIRLMFSEPLYPFSSIFIDQAVNMEGGNKMVYAVTVSGTAYLLALKNISSYLSGSVFPINDLTIHDVQSNSSITCVASSPGCLVVGRQDGSIGCYRLGSLHQSAPGFMLEYRDDVGIGRLWNLMSRGKAAGPVQHISISDCFGRELIFAAHLDGTLRVWDLIGNTRLLNHHISVPELPGATLHRLWVGDANYESGQVTVALLFRSSSDMVVIHHLDYGSGEKLVVSSESSRRHSPAYERRVLDLKIAQNELWILEEDGASTYNLHCSDIEIMEPTCRYNLHETYMSDQLLQGEHFFEDSTWASFSLLPSIKDEVTNIISSVLLRRILQPGILLLPALHATLSVQKQYTSQYAIQSLSVSELKHEISSIIESQGHTSDIRPVLLFWKKFCSDYLGHWCRYNPPYTLFVDNSSGVICLVRRNSLSLFRHLQHIETYHHGLFDTSLASLSSPINGHVNVLPELLKCLNIVNCQLGCAAAAAVLYECLLDSSTITCEDIVSNFVKEMIGGCCSAETYETTWEKRSSNHKTLRIFLNKMVASLHMLLFKASTWDRVLDVFVEYLKNLVPEKFTEVSDIRRMHNINSCLLVHAATQTSRIMFERAFNVLVFLGFLLKVAPQVSLAQSEIARIKLKILPVAWDIVTRWHILHFLGSTSTTLASHEDFSSKLSSLHIDGNPDYRSFQGKLGKSAFTLVFLLDFPVSNNEMNFVRSNCLPSPVEFMKPVQSFCRHVLWNGSKENSSSFLHSVIELSCILLRHSQYEAAEKLLTMVDANLSRKVVQGLEDATSEFTACLHLLGFCILMRAQDVSDGTRKEWKIQESINCFFRAASGGQASVALKNLSFQTCVPFPCTTTTSASVWKFLYYQWIMQLFEQYNLCDAACHFALAALEQIDEVLPEDHSMNLAEPSSTIKGRLWANVFKFSLDLMRYSDAYCAIISNPDDDSKSLCLRRFIIVLCECNGTKILCDGSLPFVGLIEKVEKELIWKAERSDVSSKPNLYKLLYGFEMYCKNWRKAASFMYRYSTRLRQEIHLCESRRSSSYQEVLCALSASINALQLVNPSQAWIDLQEDSCIFAGNPSSNKRARKVLGDNSCFNGNTDIQKSSCFMDIEMLEKEYALTLAQHLLSLVDVNFTISGEHGHIFKAVDALIQENFYDMAFTIILKFCKGSKLKSELERVFIAISQKCCANYSEGPSIGFDRTRSLLLASSDNEVPANGEVNNTPFVHHCAESPNWETLEHNLEKYIKLHPRLPVTVAETLLFSNPQIELPLWLVHMFKGGRKASPWGMTGREADPATLFRLYVDYGRCTDATNLLLEYIEAFADLRPVDVTKRKRMSAIWFPYVAVERLLHHIEEVRCSGHMVDQCDRLKELLHGALGKHIRQIKVDSEDAMVSVPV